jgi:hypothetical protein
MPSEARMTGPHFLNYKLRILLCLIGTGVMGAILYPALGADFLADPANVLRLLVFSAFIFFLVKDVLGLMRRAKTSING